MPFDANGDGKTDLVHRWGGGVNTWISHGDGSYEIHQGARAQAGYGYNDGVWFAADSNGDGKTDLVHRWSDGVNTWISNGDGSYEIHQGARAQGGYGYYDGVWFAADSNGDGKTDLVHRWGGGVNTWISNGDGSYEIHQGARAQAGYGYNDGVWFAADSNGDGKTDLVHRWGGGVNTWISHGDGTYEIHQGAQAQAGYGYTDGVWFAADSNGDGDTDLIHRWSGGVNTWISNGDGSYEIHQRAQAQAGYGYNDGVWFAADSNGDGKTDLVHRWDQGVNTWISNGDGSYEIHQRAQAQAGYGYNDGVWFAADSNGDGKTDLVHRWGGGVNTWISNGDGTYEIHQGAQAQAGYGYNDGQWPASVYSMDLLSHAASPGQGGDGGKRLCGSRATTRAPRAIGAFSRIVWVRHWRCQLALKVVRRKGQYIATPRAYEREGRFKLGKFACHVTSAWTGKGRKRRLHARARCRTPDRAFDVKYHS